MKRFGKLSIRVKPLAMAAIGLVVVLLALALWLPHRQARRAVELYRQKLRAQGEKITIEELIPAPPAGSDGTRAFLHAAQLLGGSLTNGLPLTTQPRPGFIIAIASEEVWPTDEVTNLWPGLTGELDLRKDALADLRNALTNQALFFPIDYALAAQAPLYHLAATKSAAISLAASAIVELHQGGVAAAWENLRASGRLVRLNGGEPAMISQLVRIAVMQIVLNAHWQALQCDGWQDEQLAELQADWQAADFLGCAEAAIAMESAETERDFAAARTSYQFGNLAAATAGTPSTTGIAEFTGLVKQAWDDPSGGLKAMTDRYPRYWRWKARTSYVEQLANMETCQAGIEAVRRARFKRSLEPAMAKLKEDLALLDKKYSTVQPYFRLSTGDGFIESFLKKVEQAEIGRNLLITAIAIKRHQLLHGNAPAQLAELAPKYLAEPPRDCVDGQPLRYRRNEDGAFLLYSVGQDGVDNGGDPFPTGPVSFLGNYPARLQWAKARDGVWPQPAGRSEVREYFEFLMKQKRPINLEGPLDEPAALARLQLTNRPPARDK